MKVIINKNVENFDTIISGNTYSLRASDGRLLTCYNRITGPDTQTISMYLSSSLGTNDDYNKYFNTL